MKADMSAILLAGGSGSRFGGEINKVLVPLDGKPVLAWSLEALLAHPLIGEVIVVYRREDETAVGDLLGSYRNTEKPLLMVPGGATRQASVRAGLSLCQLPFVAVQDGARPRLEARFLYACREALETVCGAAAAVPSKDTVKITDENGLVMSTTVRSRTWLMQTPQCFRRDIFAGLHEKYRERQDLTDDCMLLELEGLPVKLVEGSYRNIKLTTAEDLALLEKH